jgi:hypothetical protein
MKHPPRAALFYLHRGGLPESLGYHGAFVDNGVDQASVTKELCSDCMFNMKFALRSGLKTTTKISRATASRVRVEHKIFLCPCNTCSGAKVYKEWRIHVTSLFGSIAKRSLLRQVPAPGAGPLLWSRHDRSAARYRIR